MELDPKYCDVIVQRWADFTGRDPVREDGVMWSKAKLTPAKPGRYGARIDREEKRAA